MSGRPPRSRASRGPATLRSALSGALLALPFAALPGLPACSTVEPGGDFQFAQVTYDEAYFYCRLEPQVILAHSCGPGEPADNNGCHAANTPFRLLTHAPVTCNGLTPGSVPSEARNNYQFSQGEMALDVESAPLLTRPTQVLAHPRPMFALQSPEADLIRDWANKFSSR